ncbi:methylthioribulose-1-phosphate dehydratase [Pseudomonas sp. SORGH_AS 211]|jgi:methylthioribulose-1-phosphate dehydratase|uniref:Methylthioribulose-1-phosphate dehydratase n=1 Tax=Pseudomonas oryzihabitans TaxID=47885 RepID=A0A2Z5AAN8_9PSED|nr:MULTISPECIES: methylthioribulose 1-phosphate dehydratase [Pseudomonas]AXA67647.1 methylthioribulose-1-phosphate dehydratase [Pseudomonas oryzihabitans]MDK8263126.1 methylthioribulose 1-phosphate dehydratase [Pseudomonas oryzihabitans]MDR6179005.1 methylthioribulose-1-phosphate dehydratase [Pseudomonas sp. SORGH_AS_0211]MDR6231070.1 methylthioribulose-1-phosphate dehydratase [Pseudomonas sp. SORGH_AS_0199]QNR00020.1 methylthioribulose-1-phosphate dehydratase [Pseudomonas psychrotolerans]
MIQQREQLAREIIDAGRFLYGRGWSPATSSNYSVRLSDSRLLLTVSGKHKGQLELDDVLATDLDGTPLEDKKPSAETALHTQLYRWQPEIGAVLHTHSVNSTVLSRQLEGDRLLLDGYELQKALHGVTTHDVRVEIPVFDNDQDIPRLADQVQTWLDVHPDCVGYLIRGHGLYTWGPRMADALRHVEAFEFLFECELKTRSLRP